MKQIRGSKALVTGAAAGIGRQIAQLLADAGADLWLIDRDETALGETAESLRQRGGEVVTDTADLTDLVAITRSIDRINTQWGALHVLVNNAGTCYYGPTRDMTDEQWDLILNLNLHAPIRLIHGLLPLLEKQPEAHVVNICSMFGLFTYRKQAAYQTTKFALVGLTRSLRVEYAGTGLGFSAICPGFVRGTRFFDTMEIPPDRDPRVPPRWITCTSQAVARRTLRAIRRDQGVVVMTPLGRWAWLQHRLMPHVTDRLQQWGFGHHARRKRRRDGGLSK